MFDPQIDNRMSRQSSGVSTKRPAITDAPSRNSRAKVELAEASTVRKVEKAASGAGLSALWYSDRMEYSERVNTSISAMVQESIDDAKRGNLSSAHDTVYRLAHLRLCKELDAFIAKVGRNSMEVRTGLNRALSAAVDRGEVGMVNHLLTVGADPWCETEGSCALNTAIAFNDGSNEREEIVEIIRSQSRDKVI